MIPVIHNCIHELKLIWNGNGMIGIPRYSSFCNAKQDCLDVCGHSRKMRQPHRLICGGQWTHIQVSQTFQERFSKQTTWNSGYSFIEARQHGEWKMCWKGGYANWWNADVRTERKQIESHGNKYWGRFLCSSVAHWYACVDNFRSAHRAHMRFSCLCHGIAPERIHSLIIVMPW